MNEFEIGQRVEFRTRDGAEFRGTLHDFTDSYFTISNEPRSRPEGTPPGGILGFPFEMVSEMWAA